MNLQSWVIDAGIRSNKQNTNGAIAFIVDTIYYFFILCYSINI